MFLLWANIISGILIAVIFINIIIFDRKNSKKELSDIKSIVLTALLVSIAVVLNTAIKAIFNTVIPATIFEAKLGNFALVLIGLFCGGVMGVLGGIASDILGVVLYSSGTPMLYFTLTSVSWCVLPYYLVRLLNKVYQNKWTIYLYLPFTYAVNLLIVSGFDPIILTYMYDMHKGWWVWYLPRIIKFPIDVTITSMLLTSSYKIFANSLNLNQKFAENPQHEIIEYNQTPVNLTSEKILSASKNKIE